MLMSELAQKKCVPCMGGVPPLSPERIKPLLAQLKGWALIEDHHLEKEYVFPAFRDALAFTVKIGALAEAEGHHPVILLDFKKVILTLWTHKINGFTESDFVFAAKVDQL